MKFIKRCSTWRWLQKWAFLMNFTSIMFQAKMSAEIDLNAIFYFLIISNNFRTHGSNVDVVTSTYYGFELQTLYRSFYLTKLQQLMKNYKKNTNSQDVCIIQSPFRG
ncbi:uncharacterized protein [Henckelia pumila]|uniref:uncharacterized protein n=1 Tax=Henckelia pumila TaxID=405737 RepID=UPI003C6E8C51